MTHHKFTYNGSKFLLFLVLWELVFWGIISQLALLLGFFSDAKKGEVLAFLHPEYLWGNFIVLIFIFLFFIQIRNRNRTVKQVENPAVLEHFLFPVSTKRLFYRYFFIRNSLVFLLFALAQPIFGTKNVKGTSSGIEMVFALDISNSMNTKDMKGGDSRLTTAKRVINQLLNQSPVSRVGILVFAGSTYPVLPLTPDIGIAKMYVDELNTSFISNQGTNIGSALVKSGEYFTSEKTKKTLILITDGENHEGGMEEAYSVLKENNVEVFILGIGTEQGGIVPKDHSPKAPPFRDEAGQAVISKLNPQMIEKLAKEIGGEVLITNEPFPNLSQFLIKINNKNQTNIVDLEFEVKENRYQIPLLFALASIMGLWCIELFQKRKT